MLHPKQSKTNKCPCCGADIAPNNFLVSLETNTVSYVGRVWQVPPKLAEFLFLLSSVSPRLVSDDALYNGMWGVNHQDVTHNNLSIYKSLALQFLRPFGVEIERSWGRGYRLILKKLENVQDNDHRDDTDPPDIVRIKSGGLSRLSNNREIDHVRRPE